MNNERFDLGELTTEILNLSVDIFSEMRGILESASSKWNRYQKTLDLADWFEANEEYMRLDARMMEYRIFRLIKQSGEILEEARQFTGQLSFFPNEDCELTEYDLEINEQIIVYEEYINNPDDYEGEIPPKPPEKTRALLIFPGNTALKQNYYMQYCSGYESALHDVQALNYTIKNFIQYFLSCLKNMSRNDYAAALMDFLNDSRADKFIANPFRVSGFYTNADPVTVRFIPRETEDGSEKYKIYEYYEVVALQTLLKMDFYKALEAGFVIRRCEYCGRYFLLKKGYHTKYCDQPNPNDLKHTCAQLGYHLKGVKEAAGDDPKAQSLRRCKLRIEKDCSRGIISEEERDRIYRMAEDMFHRARVRPGMSNKKFEKSLASKNLYLLCSVERRTGKRGRPKEN